MRRQLGEEALGGRIHAYRSTEGASTTLELYGASGAAKAFTLDLQ
jgi:hypothetical protein